MAEPAIHGVSLWGEPLEPPPAKNKLSAEFLVPPFSVLNAREGWWQERKRAWISLGIKSELGRGANELGLSSGFEDYRQAKGDYNKAAPAGAAMPAMDYRNRERGSGSGAPIAGTSANDGSIRDYNAADYAKTYNSGAPGALAQQYAHKGRRPHSGSLDELPGREPGTEYTGGDAWVASENGSGTSIFDPVLCELAYRWFCPPGGQVVDPFAGGSVRGIVAAMLGRRYWGCDLRAEQVAANEQQAAAIVFESMQLTRHGDLDVLTERLPGGTKERAFKLVVGSLDSELLVYASPREGLAQVAIARVCRAVGKRCVIFTPAAKELSPQGMAAAGAGAQIFQVPHGYLSNIQAKAREFALTDPNAYILPFGLECEPMVAAIAAVAKEQYPGSPSDVWCAAGSGTLARGLRRAYPSANIHAVRVGAKCEIDSARMYDAPEDFSKPAADRPPFSSCLTYDAKVWQFAKGGRGLLWNVAEESPALHWSCGDARDLLPTSPPADLLFSCPPYGDLEKYSDDPRDLSAMPHAAFCEAYAEIIKASAARLKPNRFACFVVGDFRDKQGHYRDFVSLTIAAFKAAGLAYYNEAVLVTAVGSLPIRITKQFNGGRKLGKTHQNVLVFVKGDWRKAADACEQEATP